MNLNKFEQCVRGELRALKTTAEDLDELAESAESYRMQQELYGKAERVYCSMYGVSAAMHELMGSVNDDE